MSQEKPTDDPRHRIDKGSIKQTDTPWKQPVEKEQGSGEMKPDLEKWNENMNGDVNEAMLDELRIVRLSGGE